MTEKLTPKDLEAGWYNDPENPTDATAWRWWDGNDWTDKTALGENSPALDAELQANISEAAVLKEEAEVVVDPEL